LSETCLFCRIAEGSEPASFVHQDDTVVAFMDIAPANPGHVLVIPRLHATYLADLRNGEGPRLFDVAETVAAAVRAGPFRCEGINLFLADGEAAGQEVFHVHLHVIPRFAGDAVVIKADQRVRPRRELDEAAATIRANLPAL
jgi:diadenosine tetraphosphate (Ap4A) HIT family hydrolase